MKRILLLVGILLAAASLGYAQGSRKDDIALGPQGRPVAGAIVTVCTAAATGAPCAPLATIYTDGTLTVPTTNPFSSDGLGNYHFYAAPGRYMIQVAVPGAAAYTERDVILPSDPSSSSSGNNISAFSLNLGGNLTVAGSGTFTGNVTAPNLAVNPAVGDAVCYVSANGNDVNTGRSMGAAKLTVMSGCYDSLPALGGTIYILAGNNTAVNTDTSVNGCGIWIMGPTDPNYASPPPCWRHVKHVLFIGISGSNVVSNSHKGNQVWVAPAGPPTDRTKPFIWLSGVAGQVYFTGLTNNQDTGRGIVVGEDSSGSRTGNGVVANVAFENMSVAANPTGTNGPACDFTGASFWIFLRDVTCQSDGSEALGTNNRAAILVDGTGNTGTGLVFVRDSNTKLIRSGNGSSSVRGCGRIPGTA